MDESELHDRSILEALTGVDALLITADGAL
jgi:hypothetical protein